MFDDWRLRRYPELAVCNSPALRRTVHARCLKRVRRQYRFRTPLLAMFMSVPITLLVFVTRLGFVIRLLPMPTPALIFVFNFFVYYLILGLLLRSQRSKIQAEIRMEMVRIGYPLCLECGYDLRAQSEPRCPECGAECRLNFADSALLNDFGECVDHV